MAILKVKPSTLKSRSVICNWTNRLKIRALITRVWIWKCLTSPVFLLLILSICSGIVLYKFGSHLNDFWKAILGTMVSGFIFSIFMDSLPTARREIESCKTVLAVCRTISSGLDMLKTDMKKALVEMKADINNKNTFQDVLFGLDPSLMPNDAGSFTVIDDKTNLPINLGRRMNYHVRRTFEAIQRLERVAESCGLSSFNPEALRSIGDISSGQLFLDRCGFKKAGLDLDQMEGLCRGLLFTLPSNWERYFKNKIKKMFSVD